METTLARATFRNPLKEQGADPWLVYHDGYYYLATTTATHIEMRKARRLGELAAAPDVTIWQDETPTRCSEVWASEFYLLDGPNGRRWYLYYTASDGRDDQHRMHVLESAGTDPMGPYRYAALLLTDANNEHYAIDGGLLQKGDGSLYLCWAGQPGHVLFIAPMGDPWTICGARVSLPADGFGCKEVREGPVALKRNGKIFLVYSACDTGKPDYKLGMLIADEDSDLMNPASWQQHPEPVFTRCDANGVYGPGHNSFFRSPDGTEDWICYHAKTTYEYTYRGRSARAQPFTWTAEGLPDFGRPLSLETDIPAPSGEPPAER